MHSNGTKFAPYSTTLEDLLNKNSIGSRYQVINAGISGEFVFTEMVTRLPLALKEYKNNLKLVIILGGTNDLRRLDCKHSVNLAYEIQRLHDIVHKSGYKSVIVTIPEADESKSVLPFYDLKTYQHLWKETNNKLRHYAKTHRNTTILCDLAKKFPMHSLKSSTRKQYWSDNLHPTAKGYQIIAKLLYKVLQKNLKLWVH